MRRMLVEFGGPRILVFEEFLPAETRDGLLEFSRAQRPSFAATDRTLNDPEYQRAFSSSDVGPSGRFFEAAIRSAAADIAQALGIEAFEPSEIGMRLTAIETGGYRKPRSERLHRNPSAVISFIYFIGNDWNRFEGGHLRFLDFDPYAAAEIKIRRHVEVAPTGNSLVVLPSGLFYAMDEVMVDRWGNSEPCVLLEGDVI